MPLCLKTVGWVANRVDPDKTPHSAKINFTVKLYYLVLCLKTVWWVANSTDPDQTPQNAESDQDLHGLLRLKSTTQFYYLFLCLKTVGWVANCVDSDQTQRSCLFARRFFNKWKLCNLTEKALIRFTYALSPSLPALLFGVILLISGYITSYCKEKKLGQNVLL